MHLLPEQLDDYFVTEFPLDFLEPEAGIRPSQYLEYARVDLQDGSEPRNRINSVGNAKRALHLQVETIANGFGYQRAKRSSKFPAKLEFLGELGIATPSIISKLNALRNKVEHEYLVPELEQTRDYCDIVELFLRATESAINTFPDNVEFQSNESFDREENKTPRTSDLPEFLTIQVVKREGEITIQGADFQSNGNTIDQKIVITDNEYPAWIGQILEHIFRRI